MVGPSRRRRGHLGCRRAISAQEGHLGEHEEADAGHPGISAATANSYTPSAPACPNYSPMTFRVVQELMAGALVRVAALVEDVPRS